MIDERTFNDVRDELIELGKETHNKGISFREFFECVDNIRQKYDVPIDEMNLILDMLTNWISNNGEIKNG